MTNLAVIVTAHNRVTVYEGREMKARGKFDRPLFPDEIEALRSDPEGFMAGLVSEENISQ